MPIGALVSPLDEIPGLMSHTLPPVLGSMPLVTCEDVPLNLLRFKLTNFNEQTLIDKLTSSMTQAVVTVKSRELKVSMCNSWHAIEKTTV